MESDGLSQYSFVDFDEREITSSEIVFEKVWYSYVTFIGSKLGIDGQIKLKMVSVMFPIRSKLDYVALFILKRAQIDKLL